jgi:predicted RNA-binding Zn-ribbon protein involved in translation (DUF1610 family)
MAVEQYSSSAGDAIAQLDLFEIRKCQHCGVEKTAELFYTPFQCRECRNAKKRARYQARGKVRRDFRMRNDEGFALQQRHIRREAQRRRTARLNAAGLTKRGNPIVLCEKSETKKVKEPAVLWRTHRRHWIKVAAPGPCVAAWYALTGKPWNNPRLSGGEKFKLRYRLDAEFRAREIIKAQSRKVTRAERVAAQSDGTITPQSLGQLFAKGTRCRYCETELSSTERTADHVVPLCRGGAHSIDNLVIACRSCNSSKGRKTLEQWLESIPHMSSLRGLISSKLHTFSGLRRAPCATGPTLRAIGTEHTTPAIW